MAGVWAWAKPAGFRVLIVALAAVAILIAARGSVAATRAAVSHLGRGYPDQYATSRQFDSVRRELGATVPPGSRIYVDQSIDVLWIQRITEFAYLQDLTVTDDPRQADYVVTISQGRVVTRPPVPEEP